DVGEEAVQPVAELGAEPAHDAVDDDERGDAEHDADDADQRQVARPQIPPAEQELVHSLPHGEESVPQRHGGTEKKRRGREGRRVFSSSLSISSLCLRVSVVHFFSGLNSGNRITSRIVVVLVSSITRRSMPTPSPPAGGMPCFSARMKSSSIFAIDSS